jgi:hypothetical protein
VSSGGGESEFHGIDGGWRKRSEEGRGGEVERKLLKSEDKKGGEKFKN